MDEQTYNPWTIVNLVFEHLVDQGLHPVLGETGDPGAAAEALLTALGVSPLAEGNTRVVQQNRDRLTELRQAVLGDPKDPA
ncbi:hypothetical protein [Microlunatus speluncae]|uniref:hypothetical protein n=1 Tax=Microlunatus speluncae TaxID=2594267 RepID=UPI0012668446|nr:hypothetical protein [Microlunatus speluncae]